LEWRLGDPSGISVTDETLERSEAAHRTPPGKRPAGTEINPTLCLFTKKLKVQKIVNTLVKKTIKKYVRLK